MGALRPAVDVRERDVEAFVLAWLACIVSFVLGWWAHARLVAHRSSSFPIERSSDPAELDLTELEVVVRPKPRSSATRDRPAGPKHVA